MKKGKKTQSRQVGAQFSILNSKFSTILVVILAGIPFALGRYFEINYPDPFDSASNVYSAQHILNGARIGIDEMPSAALGTLLVNILGVWLLGFRELGPKLIQAVFQAGALVAVFIALRKLMGRLPAAVSVIVASIYLSSPLIAKFGNVKEQYMIACMAAGISFLVLRQSGGGWWYSILAGAVVSWAPLFKETGASAIGAMGLFVIMQPILRHRTWKQTGIDIALLLAGAAAALAPLYIWIIGWDVKIALPYSFVWDTVSGLIPKQQPEAAASNYVSAMRETIPFSQQWPRVLRYYLALCLPVTLALGAIITRIWKIISNLLHRGTTTKSDYDRFALLFGVWWLLDMAFVWISPASYEQYYLPLTASGAITGSYLVAVWRDKLTAAAFKTKWVVTGIAGIVLMVIMLWRIFFGLPRSPYSAIKYPEKRNGYVQRWAEISDRRHRGYIGYWEQAGEYIRDHTRPTDKIYVWGWVPGIYLSAQRFCPAPNAFESEMHAKSPEQLEKLIDGLLADFEKEMPKYIVDSRKQHLPLDRFRFELWPIVPKGFMGLPETNFLPNNPQMVSEFEKQWSQLTRERFGDDEARRFEVMGKFRKFIRENYNIDRIFGEHVVFKLKSEPAQKGV
jgi:hypothetical protein